MSDTASPSPPTVVTTVTRIIPLAHLSRVMRERITAAQRAAGQVWNWCVDLHKQCRTNETPWPSYGVMCDMVKGEGFELHSQSVQQIAKLLLANISATRELRANGGINKYPYHHVEFHPVPWTNQAMCVKQGRIILPMGRGRKSIVIGMETTGLTPCACQIVWNNGIQELHLAIDVPVAASTPGTNTATIDLGEIHLAAMTMAATQPDGSTKTSSVVVSGRGIRSLKRKRAKGHGSVRRKLARCTKGSRRWKRLRYAMTTLKCRTKRQVRDLRHKATRLIVDAAITNGVGSMYIGDPGGVQHTNCGRHHNDRMSRWEFGVDTRYIQEKAHRAGISCSTGTERGTSSTCPICGARKKPAGRWWTCTSCDFQGHRDVVGSVNMFPIGFGTKVPFPHGNITYRQPGRGPHTTLLAMKMPAASGCRSRPDTGHTAATPCVSEPDHMSQPANGQPSATREGQAGCVYDGSKHTHFSGS